MKLLSLRRTNSSALHRNQPKIAEKASDQAIAAAVPHAIQQLLIPGLISIKDHTL